MRKRLIGLIISMMMMVLMMGICANAETKTGSCGDSATYSFDTETGILTISGTGEINSNYSSLEKLNVKQVIINEGITSIAEYGFVGLFSMTGIGITIPNSVTSIGRCAFRGCSNLTSVTIPNSVTSIGNCAFDGCSILTSITIPNSVTSIGNCAFDGCSSLTSVSIPNSVTSIGDYAFRGCSSLTSAGPIGSGCDYEFGWTDKIPDNAFSGCSSLTSVSIPNSVTSIGELAFAHCSSITSISIPTSVTSIGSRAFGGCKSITSISIPTSVTSFSGGIFYECSSLTSAGPIGSGCDIEFGWTDKIPDNAFRDCRSLTSISIPTSVTYIGSLAFCGCSSLTSISIPTGVTSIGHTAFGRCSSLTSISIPTSVTSIGSGAFGDCSSLTSISIPASVTSIGDNAFSRCSSLTSINIPTSVTSIGVMAFYECRSLPSISIPTSVTSIGSYAFENCSSLTSVIIKNGNASIGNNVFTYYNNYNDVNPIRVNIPNLIIKSYSGGKVEQYCKDNGLKFEVLSAESSLQPEYEIDIAAAMATTIPEGPSTWKGKEGSEGFVYRLYNVALTRDAEEAGLKDWDSSLTSKSKTASEVAQGIFFSAEFQNKGYSDAQYIKFLYRTMFGREADEGGMKGWLEKLECGLSREYVFRGFAESAEFTNLCDSYSIDRGSVNLGNYRDKNEGATGFVARLYTKMLGRKFEVDGIEDWTRRYLTGEVTIEDVATNGFIHSQEFTNLGLNNADFVTRMYQTFLNRQPDEAGFNDWVGKLDSGEKTRDDLVFGFSKSQEFGNIKAQYGL